MTRPRRSSAASEDSTGTAGDQELGSMYDYLAKIILLGPSGTGKSCLLHRFVKSEWRVLTSQTIGVEFASKIIKVGTGSRRKRIKLQLWDTAGTERFRSVSRSYYRGAAGAILVYDVTSQASFRGLQPFLNDARALASPQLSLLLVGNKLDLAGDAPVGGGGATRINSVADEPLIDIDGTSSVAASFAESAASFADPLSSSAAVGAAPPLTPTATSAARQAHQLPAASPGLGAQLKATVAPEGREVSGSDAARWAASQGIPVAMEVSAFSGEGVDDVFGRLARTILAKIELGEVDPDDPLSGIQYGDFSSGGRGGGGGGGGGAGQYSDGASVRSGMTADSTARRRRTAGAAGGGGMFGSLGFGGLRLGGGGRKRAGTGVALREWEEVFTIGGARSRRGGCC